MRVLSYEKKEKKITVNVGFNVRSDRIFPDGKGLGDG